jgi:tripartite motif-containing protein 71
MSGMEMMNSGNSRSFIRWLVSAAALLALTIHPLRAQPFQLIREWGTSGSEPGQFHYPRAIALSRDGHVYVTDEQNGRVQVFDENGGFLFQFATTCLGIAIGPDENVYVTDVSGGTPRLHKLSSTGSFLGDIFVEGGFAPSDVAIDEAGTLYVVASEAHKVYKLASDGSVLTSWGGFGSGPGQFQFPGGIALGPTGDVFVSDGNNYRIQKFDKQGSFLASWSIFPSIPSRLDVDRFGNVYVPDFDFDQMWKLDSQGNVLATWPELTVPQYTFIAVAATGRGEVYVADTNNNRILEYLDLSVARIFSDAFESGSTAAWISSPAD